MAWGSSGWCPASGCIIFSYNLLGAKKLLRLRLGLHRHGRGKSPEPASGEFGTLPVKGDLSFLQITPEYITYIYIYIDDIYATFIFE